MIKHLKDSIFKADIYESKLSHEVVNIPGMCFEKARHLLNNIVNIPGARYLEVGVFRGATFIAALYKNDYDKAIAIDNWSENGDYSNDFIDRCGKYIGEYDLIIDNCFNVELNEDINIYFYDGLHTEEAHSKALSHFYNSLSDKIIFIVDDYNWDQVRNGNMRAVKDWDVMYETILGPTDDHRKNTSWGAGIYASVLKKKK